MSDAVNSYAEALYGLCREEQKQDEALDDVQKLRAAFLAEPAFLRLLASPEISKAEKRQLLDDCFQGKATPYVLSTLKLMCDHGRIRLFPAVCERFGQLYNEDKGILTVRVTSARPLSEEQTARLKQKLEDMSGKTVELLCRQDGACLGGLSLEYEGRRIDDTVRQRLQNIASLLKNTRI